MKRAGWMPLAALLTTLTFLFAAAAGLAAPGIGALAGAGTVSPSGASPAPSVSPTPALPAVPDAADVLDSTTPFGAVTLFQNLARKSNFADAAEVLDFGYPAPAPSQKKEITRKFVNVLEKRISFDLKTLSRQPQGDRNDGLRPNLDRVGYLEDQGEVIPLLLERIFENGAFCWKFSRRTVDKVVALYDITPYASLLEVLPRPFVEWRFLSVDLWQWCALFSILVLAWGLTWLFLPLIRRIGDRLMTSRGGNGRKDYVVRVWDAMIQNSRLFFIIIILYASCHALELAIRVEVFLDRMFSALLVLLFTNIAFAAINATSEWLSTKPGVVDNRAVISILPLTRRIVKILLAILALIYLMQDFGINVSAVVAGLGIGGLAIALAAQKTIENLFGATTVGTIEDIGIRSTRIRTLDRSRISIPNADFAQMQIENLGARDRIWFHPLLALRLDTTPDQMRFVIIEIKKILVSHPKVDPDPARVRLVKIDSYALQLEVFSYILTTDWDDFLEVQEDLLVRFLDVIARAGAVLAYPTQSLTVEREKHDLGEAKAAAEATVAKWRQDNTLYIPRFPFQVAARLRNSIKYP